MTDDVGFLRSTLGRLARQQPVRFPNDLSTPPADRKRKPTTVDLTVADPPPPPNTPADDDDASAPSASTSSSSSAPAPAARPTTTTLTVKCLKPPLVLPLRDLSPLDPISSLKVQLHTLRPDVLPGPGWQRLLVKGKALADGCLLRDYGLEDGTVVTLMLKAGYVLQPPAAALASEEETAATTTTTTTTTSEEAAPAVAPSTPPSPVVVVPTLTLSSDPSSPSHVTSLPSSAFVSPTNLPPPTDAPYHAVIASPAFWSDLATFAQAQFGELEPAERFWEVCLLGHKRFLKEGEVAKIRDATGLTALGVGLP